MNLYDELQKAQTKGIIRYLPSKKYCDNLVAQDKDLVWSKAITEQLAALAAQRKALTAKQDAFETKQKKSESTQKKETSKKPPSSDNSLLKFGYLSVDLPERPDGNSLSPWLRILTLRAGIISSLEQRQIALFLQDEGKTIKLMAEDVKGRQHCLAKIDAGVIAEKITINFGESAFNAYKPKSHFISSPNHHGIINSNAPELVFFPIAAKPGLQERNEQGIAASLNANADPAITCAPLWVASPLISDHLCQFLTITQQELVKRFKYGPIQKTLLKALNEAIVNIDNKTPEDILSEAMAAFTEKRMANTFDVKQAQAILPASEVEKYKSIGATQEMLSKLMAFTNFDVIPEFKPWIEPPPNEHHTKAVAQKNDTPVAPSSGKSNQSQKGQRRSAQDDPRFHQAKLLLSEIVSIVEPIQLRDQLIMALTNGKVPTLTAPERTSLEHIAIAMQHQPDNVDGGIRWFINTLRTAEQRGRELIFGQNMLQPEITPQSKVSPATNTPHRG